MCRMYVIILLNHSRNPVYLSTWTDLANWIIKRVFLHIFPYEFVRRACNDTEQADRQTDTFGIYDVRINVLDFSRTRIWQLCTNNAWHIYGLNYDTCDLLVNNLIVQSAAAYKIYKENSWKICSYWLNCDLSSANSNCIHSDFRWCVIQIYKFIHTEIVFKFVCFDCVYPFDSWSYK